MDPVLLRAWLPLPPDAVEAGLAERVTATHVFLPRPWLVAGADVDVGARVVVEVVAADVVFMRFAAVIAWRYVDGDVPAGREAGVGVIIGDTDADDSAVLARLRTLRGAGSGVRVPGQRVAARLRLGVDGVVAVPVVDVAPTWNVSPLPSLPPSRLLGLLEDRALGDSQPDGGVADSGIRAGLDARALAEREAMLTMALRDAGGLDTLDGDTTVAALPEPGTTSNGEESQSSSGAVERPFSTFNVDGFDFPDAPPAPADEPGVRRPFEGQSTDVDLLGEISAADVVALGVVVARHRAEEADNSDDELDLASLPSVEAELLDGWQDDTPDAGGAALVAQPTELRTRRAVPDNAPWPAAATAFDDDEDDADEDDDEPAIEGMAWSMSRRGQLGVERFTWPAVGSKRYSGQGEALQHDDDVDVFSAPPRPPELDPFAAQVTDPRLNVEGLVAHHVRAGHDDVFADDDVDIDGDPDATSDERPMPGRGLLRPPLLESLDQSLVDERARSPGSSGEGNPL